MSQHSVERLSALHDQFIFGGRSGVSYGVQYPPALFKDIHVRVALEFEGQLLFPPAVKNHVGMGIYQTWGDTLPAGINCRGALDFKVP